MQNYTYLLNLNDSHRFFYDNLTLEAIIQSPTNDKL